MARREVTTVSLGLFQGAVIALLIVIAGGVSWYLSGVRDDIRGLRDDNKQIGRDLSEFKAQTVSALAAANTKLEAILQETRQRR